MLKKAIKKAVQALATSVYAALEVLGWPRDKGKEKEQAHGE